MTKFTVVMYVRQYNAIGEFWLRSFTVEAADDIEAMGRAINAAHADSHEVHSVQRVTKEPE